jgi:hypothetical protein
VGTTRNLFRRDSRGLQTPAQIILKPAALARCASAAKNSGVGGPAEDIICRVLCLGRGMNYQSAVVAKLPKPAGYVSGLIRYDRVRDACFRTKVSSSHFRNQFLF